MKRGEIIKVTSRNSPPRGENIRLAQIPCLPLFEHRCEFYTEILLRAVGKGTLYIFFVSKIKARLSLRKAIHVVIQRDLAQKNPIN